MSALNACTLQFCADITSSGWSIRRDQMIEYMTGMTRCGRGVDEWYASFGKMTGAKSL